MSKRFRIILVIVFVVIAASVTTMGLFSFFQKTTDTAKAKIDRSLAPYTENWAAYLTIIEDDKVGSILVDLGIRDIAPIPQRPNRLRINIKLTSANERGLPDQTEFPILGEIEEALTKELVDNYAAIFPGHLYYDSQVSIYYYLLETDHCEHRVREIMRNYPSYTYELLISTEENWETYLELLYPQPLEMQSIQNHRLIGRIAEQGDQIEKERQVDHWIYFSTDQGRSNFEKAIRGKGFNLESRSEIDSNKGKPFQLHISRFDALDANRMDETTFELWQIAQECDGEYDGWETSIVKN